MNIKLRFATYVVTRKTSYVIVKKKKEITEDELKRSSERLQKLTDRYIDEMDKVGKTKELEILEV